MQWSFLLHGLWTNRSSLNQIQMSVSSGTKKKIMPWNKHKRIHWKCSTLLFYKLLPNLFIMILSWTLSWHLSTWTIHLLLFILPKILLFSYTKYIYVCICYIHICISITNISKDSSHKRWIRKLLLQHNNTFCVLELYIKRFVCYGFKT